MPHIGVGRVLINAQIAALPWVSKKKRPHGGWHGYRLAGRSLRLQGPLGQGEHNIENRNREGMRLWARNMRPSEFATRRVLRGPHIARRSF